MTKEKLFFKLVCITVDPLEYAVHEDVNKGTLEEIYQFINEHFDRHPSAEWKLIPMQY